MKDQSFIRALMLAVQHGHENALVERITAACEAFAADYDEPPRTAYVPVLHVAHVPDGETIYKKTGVDSVAATLDLMGLDLIDASGRLTRGEKIDPFKISIEVYTRA